TGGSRPRSPKTISHADGSFDCIKKSSRSEFAAECGGLFCRKCDVGQSHRTEVHSAKPHDFLRPSEESVLDEKRDQFHPAILLGTRDGKLILIYRCEQAVVKRCCKVVTGANGAPGTQHCRCE